MILLEWETPDVALCRTAALAAADGKSDCIHVSESAEAAAKEIERLDDLAEMQMAV